LREAYIFLRVVEHVLQLERDLPVRQLPREPKQWATFEWRVAFALGQPVSTLHLAERYEETAAEVRRIFGEFFDETIEFLERKHRVRELCPDLPAELIDGHFRRMESAYFLSYTVGEVAHHVEMIHELDAERLCRVDVRHVGSTRRVTVVANDYQGEFAKICGLLSAYGQSILSGRSYTYHDVGKLEFYRRPERATRRRPDRRRRRRKVASRPRKKQGPTRIVFSAEVQPAPGHSNQVFSWTEFERDLNRLLTLLEKGEERRANEELTLRVMEAARRMGLGADREEVMPPIAISIDNESDEHCTILEIRSPDSFMFLFEFANVLSTRDYWIDKVEFDTVDGEVRDRLFVTTRRGGKIEDRVGVDNLRVTVTLMKQFARRLAVAPNPHLALRQFGALIDAACEQVSDPTQALASSLDELARVLGAGTYLWEEFLRRQHENLMPLLGNMAELDVGADGHELERRLDAALEGRDEPDDALNQFKDDEIGRIDMRHLTRRIEHFSDFGAELSTLSDIVLTRGAAGAVAEVSGGDPAPGAWSLCALGKWGGRDLGYASDIELMFVWDAEGPEQVRAGELYERAAMRLARLIRAKRDGIFELDWRLRPGGSSSPLSASFQRFSSFYSFDGGADPYERQALVRLRTVAGDPDLCARIEAHRAAYVFDPRPHDLARIRHLRSRQRSELVTRGTTNAKFSAGGLLDAEYFVQVRQIAAGPDDPEVRQTNTEEAVRALYERGHITREEFEQVEAGYRLLRAVINCLRIVRGHSKDLVIPERGTSEFQFLARRLVSLGQLPDEEGAWALIAERMRGLERLFDGLSG
jgi:glutamate-ammonia-ligase adenylyltransferase